MAVEFRTVICNKVLPTLAEYFTWTVSKIFQRKKNTENSNYFISKSGFLELTNSGGIVELFLVKLNNRLAFGAIFLVKTHVIFRDCPYSIKISPWGSVSKKNIN